MQNAVPKKILARKKKINTPQGEPKTVIAK